MTHLTLDRGAWVQAPAVRVSGLPISALAGLRFAESFACATELASLNSWLADEGNTLSDKLYEAIGSLAAGGPKPGMIGLRRAVHQGRRPRSGEWNDVVAAALPPATAARIDAWISRLRDRDRLREMLASAFDGELQAKQAVLRQVAADPGFRRALAHASPSLSAELAKWLAEPDGVPQRQTLVRLAKYIARAAAKTSPYSTFTVSGFCRWDEHGDVAQFFSSVPVEGVLEPEGIITQLIIGALCEEPALATLLPLRVNPSATIHDGKVSCCGGPPREPIVSLPFTPPLARCLALLGEEGPLTERDLCDRLVSAGADRERVAAFIARLLEAGLLVRRSPVPDLVPDPLAEFAAWVESSGVNGYDDVVKLAAAVGSHERPGWSDVDGHQLRKDGMRQAICALAERAGLPPETVAFAGKRLVHENAVFTAAVASCGAEAWRGALADLDAVRRWLAPFDTSLPLRLALTAYCRERFGAGAEVPLLTLHRAVQEEHTGTEGNAAQELARLLRSPMLMPSWLAGSHLPRLRELAEILAHSRRLLDGPAGPDDVIRVDPSTLDTWIEHQPGWVRPLASLCCYVQPTATGGLVLNVAHTGYGRGHTRLAHLVTRAQGTPPNRRTVAPAGNGPLLAELSGMFGTALNHRLPGVDYEIDYPFTTSARPPAERISLSELVVRHDPGTDLLRLVSTRLGAEVVPLHLGMMADILLPPVARLLTRCFSPTHFVHPSMPLVAEESDLATTPSSIIKYRRIVVGRVVVQRARWLVPAALVPVREPGDTDAGYLLRLVQWLAANGLPARCFVRVWPDDLWGGDDGGTGARIDRWVLEKARKPVFVDFANWYLVMAFERMLNGSVVVFEEALPTLDDGLELEGQPRVSEFLIEISEGTGGHGRV